MGILRIFGKGVTTSSQKARMVLYVWIVHFLFSLILISPFYFLLKDAFSRSLAGEGLAGGFDLLWLGDIFFKHQDILPVLAGWILIPAILFLFVQIFLNGGILGRIAALEEKILLSDFLSDCAAYFFRLLRVFFLSIPAYFLVFGLLSKGISSMFDLWTENASSEWPLIFSSNIKFLVFLLLFSLIRMFFDYVKVRLVIDNSKKVAKATSQSLSFLGKNFFRAWALFLIVGIVFLIFSAGYLAVARYLPKTGNLSFILVFLWQQAYVLSRVWVYILFFSTEYHFYRSMI